MYELAIPGGMTVYLSPEPEAIRPAPRSRRRLHFTLLVCVLACHLAAIWILITPYRHSDNTIKPRVIQASWIAAPVSAAPQAAPHPQPVVQPATAHHQPSRPVAKPQPAPSMPHHATTPSAPTPAVATPIPLASAAPATNDVAAAAAIAPAPAPAAPVADPVPPSWHADYLANPAPEYPPMSRQLGEEGTVRLRVHVAADGIPTEIHLAASSGHPRLDQAALEAINGWRFVPARLGDKPVSGWVIVPISFTLRK
jgi:periplasmic protein TonB